MRHKWDGRNDRRKTDGNHGGIAVSCVRCGMVREYVKGKVTYFLNDTVRDYAGKCQFKKENP